MLNLYDEILSNPDYFKQLFVKESLLVAYQCPQLEDFVDLTTHFNHIFFTIGGRKTLNTPTKSHLQEEGSLVFLKKGAIKQGRFRDTEWKIIVFCATDNYLRQMFKEYRAQVPLSISLPPTTDGVIDIKANKITQSCFYSILPYFDQFPPPNETLLEVKCKELMFSIFSNPDNAELVAYLNRVADTSKPELPEIMEANYTYNLSLEEFARISQRSLTAFKNEFLDTFNISPGKWLIDRRLEHARRLLTDSTKNINEIVYESGFESPTHFSRVFKAKFGLAPLQYRKSPEMARVQA